jgi:3-deoxy-manno-octulosonate cytidylyltransferase (CMP-KDO synthetase)
MTADPRNKMVIVGIPARMGASRFPGKPLQRIHGLTMIEHVYKRCLLAKGVDRIIIATCDEAIRLEAESFGAEVVMTDPDIQRPGLRVAEACDKIGIADDSLVVVVQGDEPLVHPEMIEASIDAFDKDKLALVGTLVGRATESEWLDPDEVKVSIDLDGNLMYMTRSPIPSNTRNTELIAFKQVAIMPFRKSFLTKFQNMMLTPNEDIESIELLRAIEHGIKVKGIITRHSNVSVDTPEGLHEAEEAMTHDPIFQKYKP